MMMRCVLPVTLVCELALAGWFWQNPLPTGTDLHAVSFVDAQRGCIAGLDGRILRTTDGGAIWTAGNVPGVHSLYGLSHINGETAYAVGAGGTILKTADGGATWSRLSSGGGSILRAVSFPAGDNTGYVVGDGHEDAVCLFPSKRVGGIHRGRQRSDSEDY
jgi:photosystem II stability/assembly factor-like uncharacterized protein